MAHDLSNLNNPILVRVLIAVMVERCSGSVRLTQSDIDQVAYTRLVEENDGDGSVKFTLVERTKQ